MSEEIELKYLLSENVDSNEHVSEKITALLTAEKIQFTFSKKQLCNDYFDSKNLALRKMDIGLRIRTVENTFEQTIKTSGKVVDGLHKRPEYNVNIDGKKIDLSLFPSHIWPENIDLHRLENSLAIIFTTDFIRQKWLIEQGDNIIELALDCGTICTGETSEVDEIKEIEIELVKGDSQALFALAEKLKTILMLTPGNLSKAARGYRLYQTKTH